MNKEELEDFAEKLEELKADAWNIETEAHAAQQAVEKLLNKIDEQIDEAPSDMKAKILEALRAEESRLAMGLSPIRPSMRAMAPDAESLIEGVRNAIFIVESVT